MLLISAPNRRQPISWSLLPTSPLPLTPLLLLTPRAPGDDHLHIIKTVRENYEGFTKKQVQRATEARRIMLMTGVPTKRAFESMVRLNQLQDYPVTIDDVKNAHLI